jgi:hypothetical protein
VSCHTAAWLLFWNSSPPYRKPSNIVSLYPCDIFIFCQKRLSSISIIWELIPDPLNLTGFLRRELKTFNTFSYIRYKKINKIIYFLEKSTTPNNFDATYLLLRIGFPNIWGGKATSRSWQKNHIIKRYMKVGHHL